VEKKLLRENTARGKDVDVASLQPPALERRRYVRINLPLQFPLNVPSLSDLPLKRFEKGCLTVFDHQPVAEFNASSRFDLFVNSRRGL
jgi:hypothetical protein